MANRFKSTELETVQKRHIQRKIGEYFKPFRWFLTAIGRFPYIYDRKEVSKKRNIITAVKKASIVPILELGKVQESEEPDMEIPIYKYKPWSLRGFVFFATTILAMTFLGK